MDTDMAGSDLLHRTFQAHDLLAGLYPQFTIEQFQQSSQQLAVGLLHKIQQQQQNNSNSNPNQWHQQQSANQPLNLSTTDHKPSPLPRILVEYGAQILAGAGGGGGNGGSTASSTNGSDCEAMTSLAMTSSACSPMSSSSSSSPPLPPRSYKPCFVCGDKSSGYHYGVSSCEGCKGFFRRSIQKNAKYVCHREKRCEITKETRSRCQFCRLKRCLDVGMIRESVRNDRQRRRGKEKAASSLPPHHHQRRGTSAAAPPAPRADATPSPAPPLHHHHQSLLGCSISLYSSVSKCTASILHELIPVALPRSVQELVDVLTTAHNTSSPALKNINRFKLSDDDAPMTSSSSSVDEKLWREFSERSHKCIVQIVEFAKQIPGFSECPIGDKITLLKRASMDVLVLRLCSRYDVGDDSMTFSDGLTLNRTQMHNCGFGPITKVVFDFAKRLIPLDMDETEIALLSALCIACSDHVDLQRADLVERIQEPLLNALRLYSRKRRPKRPIIFPHLLMKIYELRKISLQGEDRVDEVNREVPAGSMPPLISEMLLRNQQ